VAAITTAGIREVYQKGINNFSMLKAVLFDLDDTLFDHLGCARAALEDVRRSHAGLTDASFDDLERVHAGFLEILHAEVTAGRMSLDAARRERFRRVLDAMGVDATPACAETAALVYRDSYKNVRRAIDGAAALLPLIKSCARVGIVSNNLLEEQADKLRVCGLDRFIDALVVSEEAGVAKPDAAIFQLALDRLGCAPADAVMVGDSWPADILGARAMGIPAVWFNRLGAAPPDPAVPVLRTLVPAEAAMQTILDAHRN
jgi:putative hydrolase of the HAD superfamily